MTPANRTGASGPRKCAATACRGARPARLRPSLAHQADGLQPEDDAGKPVIALINTWSDMNPRHAHLRRRAGPMPRANWRAQVLGSGGDAWKYWAELRAGAIGARDWDETRTGSRGLRGGA